MAGMTRRRNRLGLSLYERKTVKKVSVSTLRRSKYLMRRWFNRARIYGYPLHNQGYQLRLTALLRFNSRGKFEDRLPYFLRRRFYVNRVN